MGSSLSPAHPSSKFRPSPSPPRHPPNASSFPPFPSPFAGPVPVLTAVCDDANPHVASMSCCHVSCSSGSRVHPLGLLDETIARRRLSTLDLNHPEKRAPPQPLRKHFHVYPSWEFGWLPSGLTGKCEPGDSGSQSSLCARRLSRGQAPQAAPWGPAGPPSVGMLASSLVEPILNKGVAGQHFMENCEILWVPSTCVLLDKEYFIRTTSLRYCTL